LFCQPNGIAATAAKSAITQPFASLTIEAKQLQCLKDAIVIIHILLALD
jgi:hypothetical protein